ncbi:hypothetical protein GALLN_00153 [Gallionellaceae bacterium]|nr:hypothetical protein GALLN_00153 [Gallionellaceae bacterium]
MRFTIPSFAAASLLFASMQMAMPVLADDAATIPATPIPVTPEIATPEIATPEMATPEMATPEILAFGEQVADADLSTYRGGLALQTNDMRLNGNLYNNQAIANVTGSNFVTQDAFSGASGFSTVVQNSGNNVIIQNATILNISLH